MVKLAGWQYVHRKQLRYKVTTALWTMFIMSVYTGLLIAYIGRPVKAKDTTNVNEIIEREATARNICPELIEAIIEKESGRNENAISHSGKHYGLMQINPDVHKEVLEKYGYTAEDLLEVEPNIIVGSEILLDLFNEYEDTAYVLSKYHGEKNIEYRLTNNQASSYVQGVLTRTEELEREHGK